MKRRRARVPYLLLLVLLAIAGVVWVRTKRASANPALPTATATQADFPVVVRCRGTLQAARKVELTAPLDVQDLQIVWLAPSGGQAKAGDVVVRFDPSKLQQDRREKTEALKQAQASLDQTLAQARIDADQDNLDLAQANADMEKARLEASKQAIVSAIQGEESTIDFHTAEQKVTVQKAATGLHKESNRAKVASQTRLRDQAQTEVQLVERRLSQMEVKTPIAGLVSYLSNTTQGWMNAQSYKVGDHAFAGAGIAEIPDLATLEVESKVDEEDRGRIAVGDAALIHVDALPEKTLKARLASISPLTEQSFEEWPPTRTFRAYALIQQPDARLRPGMNAGADIVQNTLKGAISIPARALFTVHSKPAVYIKSEEGFKAREVQIKGRNPDEVAVEGISAGTVVALLLPSGEKQ
jgi:HlyD family secretion protein